MASAQKAAVVTGASQGLGRVVSERLAATGWTVHGTGRSARPADLATGVTYHRFDASDSEAAATFWSELAPQLRDAKVLLVNNAGGYVTGGLLEAKPEDYAGMMASAYFTGVYMTRALAETAPQARIINVVSTSALAPDPASPAYAAAKAAQMHFFQSLQQEFSPERYQITNLYPSDIATHGANPRAIGPADLADFIRELAENDASYYLRDVTLYPRHA